MSASVLLDGRGRRPPVLLSSAVRTQTLGSCTLLDAPAEAAGVLTTSDIMFSFPGTREWSKWRQRSRRKPILCRLPSPSSKPFCLVTAATEDTKHSWQRRAAMPEPCISQPSASWSASGRTQGWLCVGGLCLCALCKPPAAALPGVVSRSLVSALFLGLSSCTCVRCLSPRQQHYPAWYLARRSRLF